MGRPEYIDPADHPMVEHLRRIADALEAGNELAAEQQQLSRDVLALQRELLEQERANNALAMQPGSTHTTIALDGKVLAKAISAEQAREVRLHGGMRTK